MSVTDKSPVSGAEAAQQLFGHSSVNIMERIYLKLSPEISLYEQRIVSGLDDIVDNCGIDNLQFLIYIK